MLLGGPAGRVAGVGAAPGALAPHQSDRPADARRVDQPHIPAPTGEASTCTPGRPLVPPRTSRPPAPAALDGLADSEDMEAGKSNQQVAAFALARFPTRARSRARRRLGHVEASWSGLLGRSTSWRASTPPRSRDHPAGAATPTSSTRGGQSPSCRLTCVGREADNLEDVVQVAVPSPSGESCTVDC